LTPICPGSGSVDGDATQCQINFIIGALWINENKLLVMQHPEIVRVVEWGEQ